MKLPRPAPLLAHILGLQALCLLVGSQEPGYSAGTSLALRIAGAVMIQFAVIASSWWTTYERCRP